MQKPSSARPSEFIVRGKYKLIRKIGSGSFGDIYQAVNINNGEVCIGQLWSFCSPLICSFIPEN